MPTRCGCCPKDLRVLRDRTGPAAGERRDAEAPAELKSSTRSHNAGTHPARRDRPGLQRRLHATSRRVFPENFAETYAAVTPCVGTIDHWVSTPAIPYHILYVSPEAEADYCAQVDPATCGDGSCTLPVGTVLIAAEYGDAFCSPDALLRYSAMRKEPSGTVPEAGDWFFQEVDLRLQDTGTNTTNCANCHVDNCGLWDIGWYADATCRVDRCP